MRPAILPGGQLQSVRHLEAPITKSRSGIGQDDIGHVTPTLAHITFWLMVPLTVVSTGGQGTGLDSAAAIIGALLSSGGAATPALAGPSTKK